MSSRIQITAEIIARLEQISDESLVELLDFIKRFEQQSNHTQILSFAGIWQDMDDDFLEDCTTNLSNRRNNDIRN